MSSLSSSGWMVCSRCSLIRGIPAGRHGYLSRHTKRDRRGDARVALVRWTCYSHDRKQIAAGSEEIDFEVKTSQGLSTMWKRYFGAAGRRSGHMQVFCAKRRSCGGRHFPCSDRFPQKVLLPHTGSRSLVRSPWTSYHPDPEGPTVSKWPGFRKTTSRRFFAEAGSSVSSLVPSLSKATPACTRMSHPQSNATSRRL